LYFGDRGVNIVFSVQFPRQLLFRRPPIAFVVDRFEKEASRKCKASEDEIGQGAGFAQVEDDEAATSRQCWLESEDLAPEWQVVEGRNRNDHIKARRCEGKGLYVLLDELNICGIPQAFSRTLDHPVGKVNGNDRVKERCQNRRKVTGATADVQDGSAPCGEVLEDELVIMVVVIPPIGARFGNEIEISLNGREVYWLQG
jgi:hypothetical protein